MFSVLVRKEIRSHLLSVRLLGLMLLSFITIPPAVYISYRGYEQRRESYLNIVQLYREEESSEDVSNMGERHYRAFRSPSPLSPFAQGLEDMMPVFFEVTKEGVVSGPAQISQESASLGLLGRLDFLFIVEVLFSLVALMLTFDAICGEREEGTLKLVLSHSVPRGLVILAKYCGSALVLVTGFMCSALLAGLVLTLLGFPLTGGHIARMLAIVGISCVYISIFLGLGLLVSAHVQASRNALILLLILWVIFVLVVPRVAHITGKTMRPVRSDQAVHTEKLMTTAQFQAEKGKRLTSLYKRLLGRVSYKDSGWGPRWVRYIEDREPIAREYESRLRRELAKIDRAHRIQKEKQERLCMHLSRLSPVSALIYVVSDLCGTGKQARDAFYSAADTYFSDMDREVFRKQWLNVLVLSEHSISRQGGNYGDIPSRKNYPKSHIEEPSFREVLNDALSDIAYLIIFNILLFIAAHIRFLKSTIA